MLELLFLLLPIAAAYGWYMGQRSAGDKQRESRQALSRNYFEGLNLLLSDQPDKAVDRFIELLQVDEETFDTHLSLGNLFRKRGEVDRSIRLHQNLIARPSLTLEQKDLAMMELGKDYLAAGLLDRAEEIFLQQVKEPDHGEEAEQQLLSIYQLQKEWEKAIKVVKGFKRKRRAELAPQVAQFHCELADEAKNADEAAQHHRSAVKLDPGCARAHIGLFESAVSLGDDQRALGLFETLVSLPGGFVLEVLENARALYQRLNRETDFQQLLEQMLEKEPRVSVLLLLAEVVSAKAGPEAAHELIVAQLRRGPTMRGFLRLMQLEQQTLDSPQARDSLAMLSDMVEKQIRLRPKYRCRNCGFPGHILHWQCPSCKSWSQIQRIRGLDGE